MKQKILILLLLFMAVVSLSTLYYIFRAGMQSTIFSSSFLAENSTSEKTDQRKTSDSSRYEENQHNNQNKNLDKNHTQPQNNNQNAQKTAQNQQNKQQNHAAEKKPTRTTTNKPNSNTTNLTIHGTIPHWLSGNLIRTGPALFVTEKEQTQKWLDGSAMLSSFTFNKGTVRFNTAFVQSKHYQNIIATGRFHGDPEKKGSWWNSLSSLFTDPPVYDNCIMHVHTIGNQVCAITETPHHIAIDPNTLKSLDAYTYDDDIKAHYLCSHPQCDTVTGETFNYLTQFGNTSSYLFYSMKPGSNTRLPIATINVGYPAYVHSIAVTQQYIIFIEPPFRFNPVKLLFSGKPFLENFFWKPHQQTTCTVIAKSDGSLVGTFKTDAFFFLHTIHAFEQDKNIIIDLAAYEDPSVITIFVSDQLLQPKPLQHLPPAYPTRITISLDTATVSQKKLSEEPLEFPCINYRACNHNQHRYVYGLSTKNQQTALIKLDLQATSLQWQEKGYYPGEPLFVAKPGATKEDDGVILSLVRSEKQQPSYLLLLDATTMQEIARVNLSMHIPFDSHGTFFKKN